MNKMDDLQMLIASNKPDIMFFTEVIPKAQVNPIFKPLVELKGHDVYTNFNFTDCNIGASGIRGTAIYVRVDIKSTEVKIKSGFRDHIWVEINLKKGDSLLCSCMYRSPTNEKEASIGSTTKACNVILEAVKGNNTHLIICGDFNYPSIDWEYEFVHEQTNIIKPFINTIQNCYLYQHVFESTRFRDGNEPSQPDLIFSNEERMIHQLRQNPGLGDSDHTCINFVLNCYAEVSNPITRPNYFKANYKNIRERLSKIIWSSKLHGNFTTAYLMFVEILDSSMEGCIPEYKSGSSKKNIYLTPEAIRKKNLKNKIWRRYTRNKSSYDKRRYDTVKNIKCPPSHSGRM